MSTKNITITVGTEYQDSFSYPSAAAGDLILMQFYEGEKAVNAQLASADFGGAVNDINIDAGVGYDVLMSISEVALLNNNSLNYKLYKIDKDTQVPTTLFEGTVTLSGGSGGGIPAVNWYNGDRQRTTTIGTSITKDDDVIYFNPAEGTEIVATLPAYSSISGKVIEVMNIGAGTVSLTYNSIEILNLNTTGANKKLRARSDGWTIWS